jgi:spore germination cell wall hydrolase CwlJ-like protein
MVTVRAPLVLRWSRRAAMRPAIALALIGGLAMLALAWHAAHRPATGPRVVLRVPVPRLAGPPPAVEPVRLIDLAPDDAQAINAAVPFVKGPLVGARPYAFAGNEVARENALTCLAAAQWYEAGDDPKGQAAVAQVVLNRLRHPAFPKTVCGVVFQGAERATGCQFTFTCDGALQRRPAPEAWARARAVAARALSGEVDKAVGLATHYHTDWVVPYWSGTLDKIARVGPHLFFRWKGGWGRLPAFSGQPQGSGAIDPRIVWLMDPAVRARLDPADIAVVATADDARPLPPPIEIQGITRADLKGAIVRLADIDRGLFVLQLDPAAFAGSYGVTAVTLCRGQPSCAVVGYLQPDWLPQTLPVPPDQLRRASFYYRRNRETGADKALWNCQQVPRPDPAQCFPGTAPSDSGTIAAATPN